VRNDDEFCGIDAQIRDQLGRRQYCNNDFECSSNSCLGDVCVEDNFWFDISNNLRRLLDRFDDDDDDDGDDVDELDSPVLGDKKAQITIVMYADFQDPFSGRFYRETLPLIEENYIEDGEVNLVFKHYPLSFHIFAEDAAIASVCAHAQGEFFDYANFLYENQQELRENDLFDYAEALGLDMDDFEDCFEDDDAEEVVEDDVDDGDDDEVTGTPTFFINGVRIVGAQPYSTFERVIEDLL